jgi:hypothetical protein
MPGGLHVVTLDISHYMACGVLNDGSIACWSQYGGGHTPSLRTFFSETNPAKDVATGRYSACGLMENGSLTCWGTGFLGTGGAGQSADPGIIWPNLGSGRTAVHVELGRKHNCALLDNDAVKCWGDDQYGQMGNGGGQTNKNTPTSVSFTSGVIPTNIIGGQWHTCIATQTNEMYCWGDGVYGKLGDGAAAQNNFAGPSAKVNYFSSSNPVKAHGDITSWEINASLPSGLTFGTNNGTIYGTPTELLTQTSYMVWANNSGGSSSATINITINDQLPTSIIYQYHNITLINNTVAGFMPLLPVYNQSRPITSWTLNNTLLPAGISYNGVWSGVATELWETTSYMVWANNSGGSIQIYFNLTVVDQVPTLSYSPENLTLTKNIASTDLPLNSILTGSGTITSWEINPSLPLGLNFGSSNGTIWGIPTVLQTAPITYTIYGNNSGGSVSATINILPT